MKASNSVNYTGDEMSEKGNKLLKEEKSTITYLRDNPDFFQKNENLLESLQLPHSKGKTISLIERQVETLRKNNKKLNKQLNNLFAIAKENELSSKKMHELILSLLACNSINQIQKVIEKQIRSYFSVDATILKIFTQDKKLNQCNEKICIEYTSEEAKMYLKLAHHREPQCGYFKKIDFSQVAIKSSAEIGSMAVIPLFVDKNNCFGSLVLGSSNTQHFNPKMGTLFLQNLGEVVSHSLSKYM